MSSANQPSAGSDSYAQLITSIAVSFITTLLLFAAQAFAWVGCALDYRFWLTSASKLPLLSLLKLHSHLIAPACPAGVAPTPAQIVKQAAAQRHTRQKNALFTPARRQQAVLGVQRA